MADVGQIRNRGLAMTTTIDLERAIQIAVRAHAGQTDKQGEIYILHPLRIMFDLIDPQDKIIGVLHDVIEDSTITIDDLRVQGLPDELCADLDAVTKRKGETYTSYILRCASRNRARRVKLADLNDNLSRADELKEEDRLRLVPKYEEAKQRLISVGLFLNSLKREDSNFSE